MADYFESANNNENTNGAAPAAANGDAPMDDEILVRIPSPDSKNDHFSNLAFLVNSESLEAEG